MIVEAERVDRYLRNARARLDAVGADRYAPIFLPVDNGHVTYLCEWRREPIGVGVERCPPDPENRWPLT